MSELSPLAPVADAPSGRIPSGLAKTVFADEAGALESVHHRHASEFPMVDLKGIRLHAVTETQSVRYILEQLDAGKGGWVVTPNLDHVRRLTKDRKLRAIYKHANLVVADGMPLVWAARIQGTPLPQRVAGSNLISTLSAAAAERGRSVFLMGGDPGTAEEAARVLESRYPNVRIAGTYYPEMGFEKDEAQVQRLISHLAQADPDIVYVALGSPKQEWLIAQLRGYLPRAWWLGIGISFSFLAGHVKRAPLWMQRCGLEWVHRLAQEPRRLARRYLVDGLPFAAALLANAAMRRLSGQKQGQISRTESIV